MSIRQRPRPFKPWRLGAPLLVGLLLIALVAAACGGDEGEDGDEAEAERSAEEAGSQQQPSAEQLTEFLMRKDEEPGFRPVDKPRTVTGIEALVKEFELTKADARRLRAAGAVASSYQPTRGPRTYGATNVDLYETSEGARNIMAHEVRPSAVRAFGAEVNRQFLVPGVPGARGFTGEDKHGFHIGQVYWVQGRCLFILGNEGPGPYRDPLSAGARAIYERTKGQCP